MPDLINGMFEILGGFFITLSIAKLHHDKLVRGIAWAQVAFFACWGWWNIYFYMAVDLWWSWAGAIVLTTANTIWLCQLVYYSRREVSSETQFVEWELRDRMVDDLIRGSEELRNIRSSDLDDF